MDKGFSSVGPDRLEHMFDRSVVDAEAVQRWASALPRARFGCTDVERIDRIRALEDLKAAAAAVQAELAADLDTSVRAARAAAGVPAEQRGRGIAEQVALARRESPHRGGRHLGLAKALVHEMPHTLAALQSGRLSEWRATLLVRETACLAREDRGTVDAELCADPAVLDGVGDARLVSRAKAIAYRLDPHAVVRRRAKAESERRVTLRPAPDCMTILSALLPVADGVATYAALTRAADTARADGESRSRGQVMADTLVARATGRDPVVAGPPIALRLVMTDRSLLADGDDPDRDEPAVIPGFGPVPSYTARDLLARAEGQVWLRRLFTRPDSGELVAMDATSRRYPSALRELVALRDQTCRTPWCDSPIRHTDHATGSAVGGSTDLDNAQGLCERCNYVKESAGWRAKPAEDSQPGHHVIVTTTPTGHTYASRPPPLPGTA